MLKLLPIVVAVSFIVGISGYLIFFKSSAPKTPLLLQSTIKNGKAESPIEERIKTLEDTVVLLGKQVTQPGADTTPAADNQTPPPAASTNLESRLKSLEDSISSLQKQLTDQESKTTSVSQAPSYIPLGWVGAATSLSWTVIANQEISINPADYPGYSSMQFEVYLRAYQGNGKAYARLYNNTDGTALLSSEVSTSSQDYTWLTSSKFSLPSGQKAYRLQLKTLTGYEAGAQNARIKVNF